MSVAPTEKEVKPDFVIDVIKEYDFFAASNSENDERIWLRTDVNGPHGFLWIESNSGNTAYLSISVLEHLLEKLPLIIAELKAREGRVNA
jgi:hypothetical protein